MVPKDGVQVPPFHNKGIGRCQSGIRPLVLAWSLWPSATVSLQQGSIKTTQPTQLICSRSSQQHTLGVTWHRAFPLPVKTSVLEVFGYRKPSGH
eukprot:1145348-Pelagomonas_calceolata.AAC.1